MEGGDRRIVDYFIVAGLPEHDSRPLGEVDVHDEGVPKSRPVSADPITDIAVIIRSEDEFPPHGFDCIEITPSGLSANLNYGSIRCPEMYLCYRRGRDRPPLLDIGVMYAGKDSMRPDSQVLEKTPYGRPANVNNASLQTFLTYRRAREESPCNELVVTDICIILPGKGERPPHSFFKIDKNLNRGMVGSDVYVCYKKSMNRPNSIIYEPEILWRYPEEDYVDCPLPTSLATFCLPLGATLEWWPPKAKMPGSVFSTFVLSVSNPLDEGSVKSWYGAAVSFYEPFPASKVSHEQRRLLFYPEKDDPLNLRAFARKCVCFLSHWPFFQAYENFLTFLQRYAFSGEAHRIPIERHLSHFMHYVPFPTPQRPFVFAQLSATERLSLYLPPDSPLRLSGAKFRELLNNLDLDRIVQVIVMVLLEQKILLHSLRPDVLTSVAEALSMVIFPFQWQCPYIPLCPLGLANVISAPMPFLVGVDSRYFDLYDPPDGVICVDLDTNSLRIPADKEWMVSKVVPKRCIKPLMAALKDLQQRCFSMADEERRRLRERAQAKDPAVYVDPDADMKWERKQSFLEMDIQEAFIVFMAGLLKGYQLYLKPVSSQPRASEPTDLFDSEGFLRSRDKVYHSFYRVLVDTQMFTHFIQERSFTSSKDVSLAFFDDVVEKMENEEESLFRLLDRDSPHNQQAAMILPPEPDDLPEGVTYTYDGFDKLDVKLMIRPKAKAMLNNFKGKLHDGLSTPGGSGPGSSPMVARRIKHEIRQAQKIVKKHADCQFTWGKALLSCSISIWFTHLPSYMLWYKEEKSEVLQKAYEILLMVQDFKLKLIDEVWFRVMMQLCNQYKEGPMAVKVFALMKVLHVVPNALTYGHYNRAMLDARWSTSMSDRPSARAWRKLRNIIHVLATWKAHVRARPVRKISLSSEENISRSSMESGLSSKVPEQIAENHCESSSSNSRADDESSKGLTTPVKGKKSFFFKKRHHSSEKSKSKLLSFNRDEDEPDAEGDADEEHEKEDMLGNEETPIFPAEEKTQEILEEEKPTSPVPSSNSEEKEDKRFYESSTPSREQSQDRDAEKSGFYSTSRESSMEFKVSGLRTDSLSSVEEFKAQAAQASQKVMNWGVRLIQGGTDLVEKTKIRLVRGGSEDSKLSDEEKDDEPPQFLAPEPPKRTASPMAKSPTRTPVTENDPLGAFSSLEKANNYQTNSLPPNVRLSPIHGQPSDAKLPQITTPVAPMAPGTPRRVSLSSYGSNSSLDSPLPGGLASSLSSISSNLRKSMRFGKTFGFKTPVAQRGVVRQLLTPSNEGSNEFHRCNTHLGLVDTYKASVDTPPRNHSNHSVVRESPGMDARHSELFSGMSSSLRTAATSISKRLDSFMDAVTFTPPPNPLRHSSVYAASSQEDGMSEIDRFRGSQDSLTRMTPKRDSDSLSLSSISRTGVSPGVDPQSKVSPFRGIFARHLCCGPVGLSVRMYSCGTCHGCKAVLYDEEILSGWSPEDSNLNTKCPYCGRTEVPQLTVLIRDFRSKPMVDDVDIAAGDGADQTSDESSVEKFDGLPVDPIVVPYLSPFVLRKELESLLESEGDCCLLEPTFVDQHGIIYWNMVWFFLRIHAPSHLIDLAIKAPGIRPSCKQSDVHPSWEAATASNVDIRCYWDEPGLHFVDEDASSSERLWQMPLYLNWRGNRTAEVLDCPNAVDLVALQNLSKQIFAAITTENRLIHPVELILTELREKWNVEKCGPPNSVYREILFLSLVNCGRNIIDLWSFDREYKRAYESLKPLLKAKIRDTDMPPSHRTSLCQRMFAQLLLPTDIK